MKFPPEFETVQTPGGQPGESDIIGLVSSLGAIGFKTSLDVPKERERVAAGTW